ncbi:hypothetical protein [Pelistega indica]|nr:hypothetical protein [Pelistega indica]
MKKHFMFQLGLVKQEIRKKNVETVFKVEPVNSQAKLYRLLKSLNWDGIYVVASNKLRGQTEEFCSVDERENIGKLFNMLAAEGREINNRYKEQLIIQMETKGLKEEVLADLQWIVVRALQEYYFTRLVPQINADFYTNLLSIVNQAICPVDGVIIPQKIEMN